MLNGREQDLVLSVFEMVVRWEAGHHLTVVACSLSSLLTHHAFPFLPTVLLFVCLSLETRTYNSINKTAAARRKKPPLAAYLLIGSCIVYTHAHFPCTLVKPRSRVQSCTCVHMHDELYTG